jgi:predicted permease
MAFIQILAFLVLGLFLHNFEGWAKKILPILIQIVLWGCIPALALLKLPTLKLTWATLFPALLAWLIFALAWFLTRFWQKKAKLNPASATCLCLTMGLGNTSFVGFPLLLALVGPQALPQALIMDQAGSFLILGTWGILGLALASGEQPTAKKMLSKLFGFPPFLAFAIGLLMLGMGLSLQGAFKTLAEAISALLAPLALTAVGMQLNFKPEPELQKWVVAGLAFKLLLAPAVALMLCLGLRLPFALTQVCVLEAGMGPMITAALMASAAGLNPALASRMVGIGVPLSLLTVPLWWGILQVLR